MSSILSSLMSPEVVVTGAMLLGTAIGSRYNPFSYITSIKDRICEIYSNCKSLRNKMPFNQATLKIMNAVVEDESQLKRVNAQITKLQSESNRLTGEIQHLKNLVNSDENTVEADEVYKARIANAQNNNNNTSMRPKTTQLQLLNGVNALPQLQNNNRTNAIQGSINSNNANYFSNYNDNLNNNSFQPVVSYGDYKHSMQNNISNNNTNRTVMLNPLMIAKNIANQISDDFRATKFPYGGNSVVGAQWNANNYAINMMALIEDQPQNLHELILENLSDEVRSEFRMDTTE